MWSTYLCCWNLGLLNHGWGVRLYQNLTTNNSQYTKQLKRHVPQCKRITYKYKHTTFQFFIMKKFIHVYWPLSQPFFNLLSNIYIQGILRICSFFCVLINNFLLYVKVTDGKDTIMRSVQSIWFLWRCEAYSTLVSQLRDTHTVLCYSLTLLDSRGPLLLTSVWIVQWLTSVKFPAPSGQPSSWRSSTTAEFSVKQKFMNIMEYRQYWIISVMTNTCTNITQEINLSKTIA